MKKQKITINNRSPFAKQTRQPKAKADQVFVYDEIGFWGIQAEEFAKQLENIDGDFDLRINSPGGNVFEGVSIYESIKNHPGKVTAYVDGLAASIASVIVLAADEIIIAEAGFFMIHDPWSIVAGNSSSMRKEADLLDKIADSMVDIYLKSMDVSKDELKEMLADDTWFNAKEAVEIGLADRVNTDEEEETDASAHFDLSIYNNVPSNLKAGEPAFDSEKDLEKTLRDAGLTRTQAKSFVAAAKKLGSQRDADNSSQRDAGGKYAADKLDEMNLLFKKSQKLTEDFLSCLSS